MKYTKSTNIESKSGFNEECAIVGVFNCDEAALLAYYSLFAMQHRGQEASGISASNDNKITTIKSQGLVTKVFSQSNLKRLAGRNAIGHNRYGTAGADTMGDCQPIFARYDLGEISIAHNGNLTNAASIRADLIADGAIFQSGLDTEVIIHLIAKSKQPSLRARIMESMGAIQGAFCLVFLSRSKMFVLRDRFGLRPLSLGSVANKDGSTGYIVASETCAFDLVGAKFMRDITPGELLIFEMESDLDSKEKSVMKADSINLDSKEKCASSDKKDTSPIVLSNEFRHTERAKRSEVSNLDSMQTQNLDSKQSQIFPPQPPSHIMVKGGGEAECLRKGGGYSHTESAFAQKDTSLTLSMTNEITESSDKKDTSPLLTQSLTMTNENTESTQTDSIKNIESTSAQPLSQYDEKLDSNTKPKLTSLKIFAPQNKPCVFEYVYFARPDSVVFNKSVYAVRKNLGRQLAREHRLKADIVMPVPDSGLAAAIGYAQESGIAFELGLVRNHYVGRTFIEPTQELRELKVRLKLNPIHEVISNKSVIVIDDSLVRGTTSKAIVKLLKHAGAREVFLLISSPPTISPCFYGVDTPSKSELISAKMSLDSVCEFVNADYLGFLSLEGLRLAVDKDNYDYCQACFDGKYLGDVDESAL